MFTELDQVIAEFELRPPEAAALREVFAFRNIGGEKPALDAEPAVNAGAHPVGALMAIHVLQQEFRKRRLPAVRSKDLVA
jgi:hypothetical protein